VAKVILSYFNYNKYLIVFILIFLVIFDIQNSQMNVLSKVFAISSRPTVRQEIIDEKNDWQEWKIKNECENPSKLLPELPFDIRSLSYMSDGDKLNVTLWLSDTFSDIPSNSSNLPRTVRFVIDIDIFSVFNRGTDYFVEYIGQISNPPESDKPVWTQNIYEISAFGIKKPVSTKPLVPFPYMDKNYVEFSIDLKSIGNPDKYKLLAYIVDQYELNGEDCKKVDPSNWTFMPPPEFSIILTTSNIFMRPPEEKNITVNINTNSYLESNATLGINYANDDKQEGEEEKKVNINFISKNITISPFTNNNAILKLIALEDEKLKVQKDIPIKIHANISFPPTVTTKGGDTYHNNETISMREFSDLTLILMPPLTLEEHLKNITNSWITPINVMWTFLAGVGAIVGPLIFRTYTKKQTENLSYEYNALDKQDNIIRKEVPSIIIDRNILKELCGIIEGSSADGEDCNVRLEFIGKTEAIIRNTSKEFLQYHLPKNLKKIEMSSACKNNYITIIMDFSKNILSEFIIKGKKPEWVKEETEKIENVFNKYRNKYDIYHSGWKKPLIIIFYITLTLIVSDIISTYIASNIPTSRILIYALVFGVITLPSLLGWHKLMKKLFPKYSIKY
jgi:hypothetical protein